VWGDGSDLKEFIYVKDFIDGMLLAMERLEGFDPINIAAGRPCTVREVLSILTRLDGYGDAKIVFDASKPTMIPKRLIDPSKAEHVLGFKAKTGMEEGLRRTVTWYRESRRSSTCSGTGDLK